VALNKDLLDVLACPKCRGDVRLDTAKNALVCEACRLVYRVEDDIPVMLIDEAKPLD
jgi:uncharacterized protein YbaR (Trm112 family)